MDSTASDQLHRRRDQILEQMRALDDMRRGSLSRQFLRSRSGKPAGEHGPYFILQGYLQGRKFSQRVPADRAEAVETQVGNYKRFRQLAEEFVGVTEQITLRQEQGAKKKNSRKKSAKNASGKPPP